MKAESLRDLIELSLKANETKEVDCDFTYNFKGKTYKVYNANISYRDIVLYSKKAHFQFLTDSIGFNDYAVLHDYEIESI